MARRRPSLRFGYDALEPCTDAETSERHHDAVPAPSRRRPRRSAGPVALSSR